jgi:hypothetical protein
MGLSNTDDGQIFKYAASRANGTTQHGWMRWPRVDRGHAEHVVELLMRARFNRATVTLDGVEVGGITQDRPRGPRAAWWDSSV